MKLIDSLKIEKFKGDWFFSWTLNKQNKLPNLEFLNIGKVIDISYAESWGEILEPGDQLHFVFRYQISFA